MVRHCKCIRIQDNLSLIHLLTYYLIYLRNICWVPIMFQTLNDYSSFLRTYVEGEIPDTDTQIPAYRTLC